MASPSSTFSSDAGRLPGRLPWGLLLALVILGGAEVAMRLGVPRERFPYESGTQEYRALSYQLEESGPADLFFLGSSRGREIGVAPELARLLGEAGVNGHSVANYGLSSGFASEVNSVLRRVVRYEQTPWLVVYGVSPDQLASSRQHFSNSSLLWEMQDWLRYYERHGRDVLFLLPRAVRNELKTRSMILRWRDGVPLLLRNLVKRKPPLSSPVRGELTVWQRDEPDKVFVPNPEKQEENVRWLGEFFRDGIDWMDEIQSDLLEDSAEICDEHGIRLVFVELPLTASIRGHFPGNVYPEFLEHFTRLAERHDASFETLEHLGVEVPADEFRDSEHTNLTGAFRMTRALTEKVILPGLAGEGGGPGSEPPGVSTRNRPASGE